jgi:MFS family permease
LPFGVAVGIRAAAGHRREQSIALMSHALRHSRLHGAVARYRTARRELPAPASAHSRRGLDWMNFFVADVQTGFGTFVAFYLAHQGWPQSNIGLVLGIGGLAGVLSQMPGGALADAIKWKRGMAALGIVAIGAAALILAFVPNFLAVLFAESLHGATAGIITPAIASISLGLVGRRAMSVRTGRNYRYAAAGNAITAGIMGLAGAYISDRAIFLTAALLCAPALIALSTIRADEIDYARARNAAKAKQSASVTRVLDLTKNRGLLLFTAAVVLFQFADAAMLPMIGTSIATSGDKASLWMSLLIIVPQIMVACFAPWVGYHSERKGRRPLLLLGFGVEPLRAALLAFSTDYWVVIAAQVLNGISAAIIGVMTVIVITDLTAGTGRFNLAGGTVAALSGVAAALSTLVSGFVFQTFGHVIGFLVLATAGGIATLMLWQFLAETKPERYDD